MAPGANPFSAVNLISDPIHGYVELTKRLTPAQAAAAGLPEESVAEEDLLDTAWLQRLRRISQLQSARWVFPTAEHSRFTHGLGVRFAGAHGVASDYHIEAIGDRVRQAGMKRLYNYILSFIGLVVAFVGVATLFGFLIDVLTEFGISFTDSLRQNLVSVLQ